MRLSLLRVCAAATLMTIGVGGCDAGTESRTRDDVAADSALAADLAVANRDTLLVDSIGAYRPEDVGDPELAIDSPVTDVDTATVVRTPARVREEGQRTTSAAASPPTAPSEPRTQPAAEPPRRPASASPAPRATPPASARPTAAAVAAARRTGVSACRSPALEDQKECVRLTLASTDAKLNRTYRALIAEMRRQEGVRSGQRDPPSVQRLRVAQRTWLVYRDTECRRRGRGKEGPLWATPRVRCLGEFSQRRADELADQFSRLTAG